jgi:hypothetical protein
MISNKVIIICTALAVCVAVGLGFLFSNNKTGTQVKNEWPELEGVNVDDAKNAILKDIPDLDVVFVIQGSTVTTDYNEKRVRIFYDPETNTVVGVAKIG